MRCICTFLVMAGVIAVPAFSQTSKKQTSDPPPSSIEKAGDEQSIETLPSVVVDFEKPVTVASSSDTPGFFLPVQCSMDGRVYAAQMVLLPSYKMRIVGGNPGDSSETVTLNPSSVEGLEGVFFNWFTVTPDGITVLARAWPTGHPSDEANYLITFDKHGQATKTTRINVPSDVFRFGVFESGDIVITGLEKVNKTLKVMLLNPSGDILKYFDVGLDTDIEMNSAENAFRAQNADLNGSLKDEGDSARAVAGTYFLVPHGHNFLLFTEDPNQPVYEIGDGSIIHRTLVQYPPGDKPAFYVATEGRNWLSDVSHVKSSGGSREDVVYEIDPDSGAFLRVFRTTGIPASIVCVSQSKILGVRMESPAKNSQLQVMTFDIK